MEIEHSLLDQISKKETELKQQCDMVCTQAESRIHETRVKARKILEEAEQKGSEDAASFMERGLEDLDIQVKEIHSSGESEAERTLNTGKNHLDNAIKRITEMAR